MTSSVSPTPEPRAKCGTCGLWLSLHDETFSHAWTPVPSPTPDEQAAEEAAGWAIAELERAMFGRCPTLCDDDCDAPCHEAHQVTHRKDHAEATCPGTTSAALVVAREQLAAVERLADELHLTGRRIHHEQDYLEGAAWHYSGGAAAIYVEAASRVRAALQGSNPPTNEEKP